MSRSSRIGATLIGGLAPLVLVAGAAPAPASAAAAQAPPQVVATGLNSPRQLAFSPRGELHVAEAGVTGTDRCVPHPQFGTVCLGMTGSVARVESDGRLTRVLSGLPSLGNSPADAAGPSDLVFTGNRRVAVVLGLGGTPDVRDSLGPGGALLGHVVTADLGVREPNATVRPHYDVAAHEARLNPAGDNVDSNGTGLARSGHGYLVADAGANTVVNTRQSGSTFAVLPPVPTRRPGPVPVGFPAQSVPTDIVRGPDGAWYVTELVGFPFEKGSSTIWRYAEGRPRVAVATGLSCVTSLDFADDGTLYAVEVASDGLLAGPVGALVRIGRDGSRNVVAGGLAAPYGVAIRDGHAYVSTGSTGAGGTVVRVRL